MASEPTASPERGVPPSPVPAPASLPAPDNSNSKVASSQMSTTDESEVKYPTGLMPAEYVGLEVAQDGRGQYHQPAEVGANTYYQPYQDKPYDQQQQQHQLYPQSAVATTAYGDQGVVPPKGEKRIFGVRVATFWVALLAVIFLLGTIGASAAAGSIAQSYAGYVQTCQAKLDASSLSSNSSPSGSASASAAASAAASSASSATSKTATSTSASASATATSFDSIPLPVQASSIFGDATTNCPQLPAENKTYTVPGSNLRFVRECGKNYPFNDLGYIPLTRMEDCMNLCAALSVTTQSADGPCIGVAWVTAGKQGTDQNYCWLKSAKGTPDPKSNVEAAWLTVT